MITIRDSQQLVEAASSDTISVFGYGFLPIDYEW